jgi:hypothetical protein
LVDPEESDRITSYRETVNMVSTEGVTTTLKWSILTEWVRSVPAKHLLYSGMGDGQAAFTWEIIQIAEVQYMRMGDAWIVTTGTQDPPTNPMLSWADPSSWSDDEHCAYKGKETVNGMETKRWHCDGGGFMAGQAASMGLTTVDEGASDSWISTEFEMAVKTVVDWKGKNAAARDVTFHMDKEIKDINQPIEIKAPENTELPGLPKDIPMMEGATEVMAMPGIVTFKIAKTPTEVTDFYDAGMRSNGWTKGKEIGVPGMLQFTKDTRTAQIIISAEGTGSTVMISVQEQ